MKNTLQMLSCGAGGILIGFFANRLHTAGGASLFALGVLLLAGAVFLTSKKDP